MKRLPAIMGLSAELYEPDGHYVFDQHFLREEPQHNGRLPKVIKLRKLSSRNPFEDEFPSRLGPQGRAPRPNCAEELMAVALFQDLQKDFGARNALRAMGDAVWLMPWYEQVMHPKQWAEKHRPARAETAEQAAGSGAAAPLDETEKVEAAEVESGRWAGMTGEQLAVSLAAVDVEGLDDTDTVDYLSATERLGAWIEAKRVIALERFARHRPTEPDEYPRAECYSRSATSEVALAVKAPDRTASGLLAAAVFICRELPRTLQAMIDGHVDLARARVMMEYASQLPDESVPVFESEVLPLAEELTRGQLKRRARRIRERLHPESIDVRHKRAARCREVSFLPAADGMMEMFALLPAVEATMIQEQLDKFARAMRGPTESRTLTQLRADVFCDLLLNSGSKQHGRNVKASINLTLPLLSAMGLSQTPADLDGYGPIPADIARQLAGEATSWLPILTDPVTGSFLRVGRRRRRPPKELRRWLRIRDGHCRFPGCNRAPSGCELDHTKAVEDGGCTDHDNLCLLCEVHHRLKHRNGWKLAQERDGLLIWETPTGHRHRTTPDGPPMVAGTEPEPGSRTELEPAPPPF